ncbi:helix-turn-helix domain-containing protein [Hazenella sp. IB182353]|uniref:helix-turn-helix domain-containing protein n=1 Tax=Polycladospora coralii TaxID=2771432 RepID=UPI001746981A|nr:helix-turn-helix transcriptional regulator [Polycladospora coralii]MBS7530836.1 helix-turn-helix domain-containing protein [Polycladospora coralii]
MSNIGAYLKEIREQKGYSLEEMNHITNIQTNYLHALENEDFHLLPSPFYTRAFLRTYAKSLGIDAQALLGIYEEKYSSGNQIKQQEQPMQSPPIPRRTSVRSVPPQTTPSTSGQKEKTQITPKGLPPLPGHDLSQHTLAPRRVAMAARRLSNAGGQKKKPVALISLIVSGFIIVGGTGVYFFTKDDSTANPSTLDSSVGIESPNATTLEAGANNTPVLEEGSLDDYEYANGQLYTISNVDELNITIKGIKGQSTLRHGDDATSKATELINLGKTFTLPTSGKKEYWFVLGQPSNVEISVNGQAINTEAQDVTKSYRIQMRK